MKDISKSGGARGRNKILKLILEALIKNIHIYFVGSEMPFSPCCIHYNEHLIYR